MAMSDHHDTLQQEQSRRHLGLPYDRCRPTATRFRTRAWNPDDPTGPGGSGRSGEV
jgi:hypothetical protein